MAVACLLLYGRLVGWYPPLLPGLSHFRVKRQPPLAAFRSRKLLKMMSNRALNSNEALEESTATSSSVMLSGARREKEAPDGLAIEHYSRDPGFSSWLLCLRQRSDNSSY